VTPLATILRTGENSLATHPYVLQGAYDTNINQYTKFCSWCFARIPPAWECGRKQSTSGPVRRFFRGWVMNQSLQAARKLSQEDMISYGFSARHWQMIEAGRPITIVTLLRVSDALEIPVEQLIASVSHHLRKRKKEE